MNSNITPMFTMVNVIEKAVDRLKRCGQKEPFTCAINPELAKEIFRQVCGVDFEFDARIPIGEVIIRRADNG